MLATDIIGSVDYLELGAAIVAWVNKMWREGCLLNDNVSNKIYFEN